MSATEGAALRPVPVPPREDVRSEIWNLPNSLTLFRIFLVPFLVVVLLTKFSDFVGLAIFLVAAATDYFDGYFARRMKKTTRLGALRVWWVWTTSAPSSAQSSWGASGCTG